MLKKILFILFLVLVSGCSQAKNFSYGLGKINEINSKYSTTMETYPEDSKDVMLMINDFTELRKVGLSSGQEQFNIIIEYRLLNLEAEEFYRIDAKKYGDMGTTKTGFGCSLRPLITESVALRNASAQKGFEAASLLKNFIEKYPKEANLAGFSLKNILFLNASFFQIHSDAEKDSSIINNFCPENTTLEIYRQQFLKSTNHSKDYINNLTYEQAVLIWKDLRGI